jgi:[ribosomal protein S18]-alanine N-acetyltransferase
MNGPVVRDGGARDLSAIMPIMHSAFDPQFGEAWTESQCLGVLTMPGSGLLIADLDPPAGFALLRIVVDECELMLIAVAPSVQRKGIGRMLLDAVIAKARHDGAATVFLEMRSDNSALALYAAAGFVEVGRRRGYYRGANGQIRDALTYRLNLT